MPTSGEFSPVGTKGDDTIRVFGLNDDTSPRRLPTARKQALIALCALLSRFDELSSSEPDAAQEIKATVQDYPFSAVLHWLVATSTRPGAAAVLDAEILRMLRVHDVAAWLV